MEIQLLPLLLRSLRKTRTDRIAQSTCSSSAPVLRLLLHLQSATCTYSYCHCRVSFYAAGPFNLFLFPFTLTLNSLLLPSDCHHVSCLLLHRVRRISDQTC